GVGIHQWKKSVRPKVKEAASDEEHLAAAQAVGAKAALGVLLGVGADLTPIDYLDVLPRFGMRFVRLAFFPRSCTDPSDLSYIDRAKQLGLTVSVNLMQTYTLPLDRVVAASIEAARRGADWFYVVDSAGCMTAAEVQRYVSAIGDASGLEVGFHAHNN